MKQVLKAFSGVDDPDIRLVVKAQVERQEERLNAAAAADSRIEVVLEDLPTEEHLRRFAAADVCLAPSRWEGLGLHLYEATALGLPTITNDHPPMNEVIADGMNGVLVRSRRRGRAKSGIPAVRPSVRDLRGAIARLAEPGERERLRAGVARKRDELAWSRTVEGYARLIELAG